MVRKLFYDAYCILVVFIDSMWLPLWWSTCIPEGRQGTLEKRRHCGASLSEFANVAHGRAYAAVQTYMYVDVCAYVRT